MSDETLVCQPLTKVISYQWKIHPSIFVHPHSLKHLFFMEYNEGNFITAYITHKEETGAKIKVYAYNNIMMINKL